MKRALALMLAAGCATASHVKKMEAEGEALRLDLAESYVHKKSYVAAIPLLRRSVDSDPKDPRAHVLFGVVLREQGLYPQAEKELKTATELKPSWARGWKELGVLHDLQRRPADAERAHRNALELAPKDAEVWNNLGFSLYVAGRTEEAIPALEKALALDPGLIVAYNNLGFAYGRAGRLDDAERSFRTAGGEQSVLVNMAIVHEKRGETDTAERMRAEAKLKDPKLELEVP